MKKDAIGIVFATLGDRVFDQRAHMKMLRSAGADYIISVIPRHPSLDLNIVQSESDEVFYDDGQGQAAALKLGFEAIRKKGLEFWNWSNDDDLIYPDAYTKLSNKMRFAEGSVLAFGNCIYVDGNGMKIASSRFGKLAILLLRIGPDLIPSPSALMSVQASYKCGDIRTDAGLAVDYDLFLRLKREGSFSYLNSNLAEFGWTETSRTRSQRFRSSLDASRARIRSRGKFSPLILIEPFSITINYLGGKLITLRSRLLSAYPYK